VVNISTTLREMKATQDQMTALRTPRAACAAVCTAARAVLCVIVFVAVLPADAHAQRVAKYGADFLAGGVGARALGMGGAHVALADDVDAGYWNPAGLTGVSDRQLSYMHAERFSGIVSFDYAGYAMPISDESVIGLSFFRSGVNDIKNTLDAWDPERNQPRPNPSDHITSFSAADYAFFVGYGRRLGNDLRVGVTAKVIRRTIGDFAEAWGYSFDVGARLDRGAWQFGANLQNLSTMLQSWSVNNEELTDLVEVFGEELPEGGTELVLPVARLGAARSVDFSSSKLIVSMDADVAFDGQQANSFGAGDISLHPRLGAEYSYMDLVAVRVGFSRIQHVEAEGLDLTPTAGAGLRFGGIAVDYSFGDFAGLVSDLGYSHRVSARYSFSGGESQ